MEPLSLKSKEYFIIEKWKEKFPGLIAGITSKNGGYSRHPFSSLNLGLHVNDQTDAVVRNRGKVADLIGFPLSNWVGAEQTHETHIEKVSAKHIGKGAIKYTESFKATDGFFTAEKGILLTLCYADCVPLFFCHEQSGAIGAAHAGWKGTVNGIAREMVRFFQREGMVTEGIHVVIGPSICSNCYIVDEHVISLVEKRLEDVEDKSYNQIKDNQYKIDLKQLNKNILLNEGILEENIHISNYCTGCHNEHFFSHRKDNGKTGRMMSFIGWKEDF